MSTYQYIWKNKDRVSDWSQRNCFHLEAVQEEKEWQYLHPTFVGL